MFLPSEFTNSSHPLEQRGTIELNLEHVVTRQPLPKVLAKMVVSALMFLMGVGIVAPFLPFPAPVAIGCTAMILACYCTLAHYVRPRPNFDNMGWFAGLCNDPCQFNDNINRTLWNLSCLLGPGRFMSASTIEMLVSCHLLSERTEEDVAAHQEAVAAEEWEDRASKILERIEEIDANRPAGRTQLASMRFLQGSEQDS